MTEHELAVSAWESEGGATYADQRAHNVTWMTAAERNAYNDRMVWPVLDLSDLALLGVEQ